MTKHVSFLQNAKEALTLQIAMDRNDIMIVNIDTLISESSAHLCGEFQST